MNVCHPKSSLLLKHWFWDDIEFDDFVLRDLVSKYYGHNLRWDHARIDWDKHVTKKQHEGCFERTYRMTFRSFRKLQFMLSSSLVRQESKCRSSSPVPIYSIVAIGIRYLAGASYIDLADVHGVSFDTVYKCVHSFLLACLECDELQIKMPDSAEKWESVRKTFASKSYRRLFKHCVGAIDGFFQPTITPKKKDTLGNQRAYFSGHYSSPGLNCQAICDGKLRFLYFGVIAPGGTNDSIAYFRTGLNEYLMDNLPYPLHLVGDAAYIESNHLVTPYTGSQKSNPHCDAFNYYMSQCRIRIEMAFGRMSGKWNILQKKLRHNLSTSSKILQVCAILHNYVLNENFGEIDVDLCSHEEHCISPRQNAPFGMSYLPNIPDQFTQEGFSTVKLSYLHIIRKYDYRRPHHNLVRKINEKDDGVIFEFVSV